MKALTICQPYPFLICLPASDPRHKRVENRSWATAYRGELAIHSGKSRAWLDSYDLLTPAEAGQLVYGAVVAVARLTYCEHVSNLKTLAAMLPRLAWLPSHQHAEGPWCWVLEDIRVLKEPIPCAGARSLRDWEPLNREFAAATPLLDGTPKGSTHGREPNSR